MEQSIREVTGDEAKMAVLQFLGQNLGEMKDLDKRLVNANQTLRPVAASIDPNAVIHNIPQIQTQPAPAPVYAAPIQQHPEQVIIPSPASLLATAPITAESIAVAAPQDNKDQLEFSFNESPYSEKIFQRLESIESSIKRIQENQARILEFMDDTKKKD
jgi:hypothetical protein